MSSFISLALSIIALIINVFTLIKVFKTYKLLKQDVKTTLASVNEKTVSSVEEELLKRIYDYCSEKKLTVGIDSYNGLMCLMDYPEDGKGEAKRIMDIVFPLSKPGTNEFMRCWKDQQEKIDAYIKGEK